MPARAPHDTILAAQLIPRAAKAAEKGAWTLICDAGTIRTSVAAMKAYRVVAMPREARMPMGSARTGSAASSAALAK